MIGVQTTFYGYRGDVVGKVKKLIGVFESLGMPPFVQIGPSVTKDGFDTTVSKLNSLKDRHGVEYSVHQSVWLPSPDFFLNLGSSSAEIKNGTIESLERSVEFARGIGAKNVSFHPGCAANKMTQDEEFEPLTIVDDIPYREAYSNVKDGLKKLQKHAKKDVKLSIENLNYRPERRYLFSSPEDFKRLPSGAGVLFDSAHAYFSGIAVEDSSYVKKMVGVVEGKISEIHASDNDGSEDQHKLPSYGIVPFSEMLKLIAKKQKLPPVIVEAAQVKNGYSEDDLKKSIKFLVKLVDEF